MLNTFTLDDITECGLFCDGDWIEKKDQDENGKVRLIQLADIGDGCFLDKSRKFINEETAQRLNCTFLQKGDILVSRLGVPLGKACIFPYDGLFITAVDIAIVRVAKPDINTKYMMHLINSSAFRAKIAEYQSGTTRKRISRKNLVKIKFPLPEIDEQERIVSRIEELFSELDYAVETLIATKKQLEVYRQAVLKDVFGGISGCEIGTIQSVCDNVVDCPHSTPKWVDNGKLCLRTTNFKRGYLDLTEKNFVTNETFDMRNKRLVPQPGDVLYSREGAILGIACIIPKNTYVCLGQRMMLLRTNEKMLPRFLMHYLNSPSVTAFVATKIGGSASPHVNVGDIKNFEVPIPTILHQTELLEQIESRLSVCESIENTVDSALAQASAMRQSILKQAFEGGLQ